jgi:hypothetical protein
VGGAAVISQSGTAMNINQATNKAIINWNTVNIGSAASVNFKQPSASAIALNRVQSVGKQEMNADHQGSAPSFEDGSGVLGVKKALNCVPIL